MAACEPLLVFAAFALARRPVTESRGWRAFEGAIGQSHVRLPDLKRFWIGQRSLGAFHVWKQFFISHQVPRGFVRVFINRDDAQQTKAALKLKDQIVTGSELWHADKVSSNPRGFLEQRIEIVIIDR